MPIPSAKLWSAIFAIGSEDGTADKIAPEVIGKLIRLNIVELGTTGLPQLSARGERAFAARESGDVEGEFPELHTPMQTIYPELRKQLLSILAGVDQLQAGVETMLANPVYPDMLVRAEEVRAILADMQARVESHLDQTAGR